EDRGLLLVKLIFFFQAEDGIRDKLVTGVQTCALPIYRRVQQVCIWTPDKDLAQCVSGDRVVQVDRKSRKVRNAAGVREKFGVEPALIPDFLALVGDSADGYPGDRKSTRLNSSH